MTNSILFVTGNAGKLREVEAFLSHVPDVTLISQNIDLTEIQAASPLTISRHKAEEAFRIVNHIPHSTNRYGETNPSPSLTAEMRAADHEDTSAVYTSVLVEDTSLGFQALGDLPGPYIKWFLQRLGVNGLVRMVDGFATDNESTVAPPFSSTPKEQADTTSVKKAKLEASLSYREATALCVFSYCEGFQPGSTTELVTRQFIGKCHGHVVKSPRGGNNFGWDSIFAPHLHSAFPLGEAAKIVENTVETKEGKEASKKCTHALSLEEKTLPNELGTRTFAEMTMEEKGQHSHRGRALASLKAYLEERKIKKGL